MIRLGVDFELVKEGVLRPGLVKGIVGQKYSGSHIVPRYVVGMFSALWDMKNKRPEAPGIIIPTRTPEIIADADLEKGQDGELQL